MLRKAGLFIVITVVSIFCMVQLWRVGSSVAGYIDPQVSTITEHLSTDLSPTLGVLSNNESQPEETPSEIPKITSDGILTISYEDGVLPDRIIINKVDLSLPVKFVPLIDGTWAVNEAAANYAEGSGSINSERGNIGLFGHDRDNAFHKIKELVAGDEITLYADGVIANYEVTDSFKTEPTSIEVFADTETPTLTLVTCDSLFNNKRYIVKASLVNIATQ